MIRKMSSEDIPEVQNIDMLCFSSEHPRRTEGIEIYMKKSSASLVYEENNKVKGYIFNHVWGNFGWFGAFGIHPEFQGKGIGKKLLSETIDMFKKDFKIKNIGMSTMPESPYNIGFYTSLGFKPMYPSLIHERNTCSSEGSHMHTEVKASVVDIENSYTELMLKAKALSGEMSDGLDLLSQLQMIKDGGFGFIIEITFKGMFAGFALCHTKHIRNISTKCLEIRMLCITGSIPFSAAVDEVLGICDDFCRVNFYESIKVFINTGYYDIYSYLFMEKKFKVIQSSFDMIMGDVNYPLNLKGSLLCRWAG
jgi:ribosomal protein S18 acetylase RimI-like enzyme